MLQASILDCVAFDPFSFKQDCLTAGEVTIGRRQISLALMIAPVVKRLRIQGAEQINMLFYSFSRLPGDTSSQLADYFHFFVMAQWLF